MADLLRVTGLSKQFAQFSLRDVSFSIPGGSVMGFIGKNGAGKTTTLKLILGMLRRDAGRIQLFGKDFDGIAPGIKEQIGVVMDNPFYVDEWTLLQLERALSPFYPNWDPACYRDCLHRFSLGAAKRIKELSRGMKVKLMVAVALSHKAKLLLLDEPTSGLDPVARDELLEIFRDFVCDEEHAILFSTHITSDLEKIADYVTFLQNGHLLFTGETQRLLEEYCLVRGGRADLSPSLRDKLRGLREHSVGFEGLLPCREGRILPPGVVTEACTLEDIMVYMNQEERAL